MPIAEHSKKKTAFTTPFGLYEFVTMPFGLHGAAAGTIKHMMDKVLQGTEDFAAALLDDIVVFCTSCDTRNT